MCVGVYVQTHHNKLWGGEARGEESNKDKENQVNVDSHHSPELCCPLLVCARQVLIT